MAFCLSFSLSLSLFTHPTQSSTRERILQQNSLARHWAQRGNSDLASSSSLSSLFELRGLLTLGIRFGTAHRCAVCTTTALSQWLPSTTPPRAARAPAPVAAHPLTSRRTRAQTFQTPAAAAACARRRRSPPRRPRTSRTCRPSWPASRRARAAPPRPRARRCSPPPPPPPPPCPHPAAAARPPRAAPRAPRGSPSRARPRPAARCAPPRGRPPTAALRPAPPPAAPAGAPRGAGSPPPPRELGLGLVINQSLISH